MLSLLDYLQQLTNRAVAAYQKNGIIRPDADFYQRHCVSVLQKVDTGLLLQTLQMTNARRLHLRCDDWQQTDEFFGTFLTTLCFYKFARNQTEARLTELYKAGTVLFHPGKAEARVVVSRHATGIVTRPVKEETVRVKGDKHTQLKTFSPSFEQAARYIPLANVTEHAYNRNALGNLIDYFNLFNDNLHHHRALTHFSRRLLVVAPHTTIQQLPSCLQLPIRYQFSRHYTVPVVNPLVEVVNRYADARPVLRRPDNTIDEVVVLGDIGYRESLNDLINDIDDGYIQRVLILGSQPIQPEYGFRCWPWSQAERSWLRTGQTLRMNRVLLSSEGLLPFRDLFLPCAQQLMALGLPESEAFSAINRLISQHLRDALVDTDALLNYQQTLLEEPDSVWCSWFFEANQSDLYPTFCTTLMKGLRAVADHITTNPAKLTKIKELAGRYNGRTWIVVRPKQADALNQYLAAHTSVRAISYRELKSLLNKPMGEASGQFIFPSLSLNYQPGGKLLRDYCLYQRALECGPGYVLAYEGLEDGLANLCEWLYQRDQNRCLTHPDRQYWVEFSYQPTNQQTSADSFSTGLLKPLPVSEAEVIDHMVNELALLDDNTAQQHVKTTDLLLQINESFTNYFGVWKDIRRSRKKNENKESLLRIAEPVSSSGSTYSADSSRRYLISFDDNTGYEYKGSQVLGRVEGTTVNLIKAANAQPGDLIVRFSIRFDTCFEDLRTIPAAREALDEVKWASKAWRNWLRKSIEVMAITHNLPPAQARLARYRKLLDLVQASGSSIEFVQYQRFEQWLDNADDYIFPRAISHLQLILETHLNQVLPADKPAKQQEMQRIIAARDQSTSFREVVTKLNNELTQYLITRRVGPLLRSIPEYNLNTLLSTRTDRYIQHIKAI